MSPGAFSGSSNRPAAPAVSLPPEDAHRVTGEEEERSVYTGAQKTHQARFPFLIFSDLVLRHLQSLSASHWDRGYKPKHSRAIRSSAPSLLSDLKSCMEECQIAVMLVPSSLWPDAV